jgi:Bacterial surface proteins containing Ig-like domains
MKNSIKKLTTSVLLITAILFLTVPVQPVKASEKYMIGDSSLLLGPGETHQVSIYEISKNNVLVKTEKKVIWSSSNKKVAVVDNKGLVKSKSEGKAIITGKLGTKKYVCKLTVKKLKEIDLNKTGNLSLKGKLRIVITTHIGNGEEMTCYILTLSTPVKFSLDGYQYNVTEIQLVPQDQAQVNEFKKAEGTVIKVKGEIITGDTAWYIRDFGMMNLTLEK